MRIGLYSSAFSPSRGGLERFGETLARWLVEHGHDVVVMASTPTASTRDDLRILRGRSSVEMLRVMRSVDVVHVSGLSAKGIAMAITAGRIPVVTHHGYQAICPTGLAASRSGWCTAGPKPGPCGICPERGIHGVLDVAVHRAAAGRAKASVYVSHDMRARLGLPGSVIYNPVILSPRFGSEFEDQGDEIAFAGRLVHEKGLDVLLEALRSLPDARLRVAGDGPLRGEWERLAEELGVASRTSFLGERSPEQIAELFAASTIVCVPSVGVESFGYAAAEAMTIGRCVVGLPTGALTELLSGGRGFVADGVSSEALAAALSRALSDREARRRAGDRARRFALHEFTPDVVGARYLEVYER